MTNTPKIPFQTLLIYNAHSPSLIIDIKAEHIKELKITIPHGQKQQQVIKQPIALSDVTKNRAFNYQISADELCIRSLEPEGEILSKIVITNLKLNPNRNNAAITIQKENEKWVLPIENYNSFINSFYACTTDNDPKNIFEAKDADNIQLHWNGHPDCIYKLSINGKDVKNVVGFRYKVNPGDLDYKNYCQLKAIYKGQPNVEIVKQWAFEIKFPDFNSIKLLTVYSDTDRRYLKVPHIHDYKEDVYYCGVPRGNAKRLHLELPVSVLKFINKIFVNDIEVFDKSKVENITGKNFIIPLHSKKCFRSNTNYISAELNQYLGLSKVKKQAIMLFYLEDYYKSTKFVERFSLRDSHPSLRNITDEMISTDYLFLLFDDGVNGEFLEDYSIIYLKLNGLYIITKENASKQEYRNYSDPVILNKPYNCRDPHDTLYFSSDSHKTKLRFNLSALKKYFKNKTNFMNFTFESIHFKESLVNFKFDFSYQYRQELKCKTRLLEGERIYSENGNHYFTLEKNVLKVFWDGYRSSYNENLSFTISDKVLDKELHYSLKVWSNALSLYEDQLVDPITLKWSRSNFSYYNERIEVEYKKIKIEYDKINSLKITNDGKIFIETIDKKQIYLKKFF